MKNKILKFGVILLIFIISFSLNVFAANGIDLDIMRGYSGDEVLIYYETYGEKNFATLDTDILKAWKESLISYTEFNEEEQEIAETIIQAITKVCEERGNVVDIDYWKPSSDGANYTKLTSLTGKILGVIQVVGSVLSVAVLAILGIKYMFASLEQRATYKQTAILYVVGCILVFGISNIAKIIYDIAINLA